MTDKNREELIIAAASKMHDTWCQRELKAFYDRFLAELKTNDLPKALQNACLKDGKKRNEIELDTTWLQFHEVTTAHALETFEGFMELVNKGVIQVKRFVSRELTEEEQKSAGQFNYNPETKQENILRTFTSLSAESKKENLAAATSAADIYIAYCKKGATLEQFKTPTARKQIGTLIHADWMSRNEISDWNRNLFVKFSELDEATQQQDLDVFDAVFEEVEKDPAKYAVAKSKKGILINPQFEEEKVLAEKLNEDRLAVD